MINICLCDDDEIFLNNCFKTIEEISIYNNIILKIDKFKSGESLLFDMDENINKYDIIVMDMIMKNMNGIDTTKLLRTYGYDGIIIFLTSSQEFALEAFEVEPLNYVLKNDRYEEKFKEIFLKAVSQITKNSNKKIVLSTKQKKLVLSLNEIMYIESINKKVILYMSSGESKELSYTLNSILQKIEEFGFIHCHKSYIVNSKYIISFNKLECKLNNEILIPIGRRYLNTFKIEFSKNEFENIDL